MLQWLEPSLKEEERDPREKMSQIKRYCKMRRR
jgi:hypothetical protein